MSQSAPLATKVLGHALALVQATTLEELSARAKGAASEITSDVAEPEPLLALLAAHEAACRDRLAIISELRALASSDPLTGLLHHRPLADRLAANDLESVALVILDIDGFKGVNDTHGHPVGDRVLVSLANALRSALPDEEDLYRVGGDEFVALVPVDGPESAEKIGRRLCDAARQVNLTVSVGVAVAAATEPATSVLRRADAALYDAKRAGRDTVQVAPPPPRADLGRTGVS